MTFLIFFKIILNKSLILLENDPSAIMGRKKFDENMHNFLLAVVA